MVRRSKVHVPEYLCFSAGWQWASYVRLQISGVDDQAGTCTTLLLSNSISLDFLNVSRPHVRRFINSEYRKDILLLRRNARSLTMHCECCSRGCREPRSFCRICYNRRAEG